MALTNENATSDDIYAIPASVLDCLDAQAEEEENNNKESK